VNTNFQEIIMAEKNPAIEAYIEKFPQWEKELTKLVRIIRKSKLEETIKWGMPNFCLDGKMVIGIGAFKNHFGIWYFQGALLKDKSKVLKNAQPGKTQAMRQWKLESMEDLDVKLIHAYNQEAIENQKAGKRVIPTKRKPKKVAMPIELKEHLKQHPSDKKAFEKLTPGRQNEVKEYIGEAKRASTRINRLAKSIDLLLEGKTPMDMYRK